MTDEIKNTGMESLRELYKIGVGPSSSHTMGPERAAKIISLRYPDADKFIVTLYGSLSKTGIGHRTDYIIKKTLSEEKTEIIYDNEKRDIPHPNTMRFQIIKDKCISADFTVMSIGGGTIRFLGEDIKPPVRPYNLSSFSDISAYCSEHDMRLWQYVEMVEGFEIWDFLQSVWDCMKNSVKEGIQAEGDVV